MTKKKKSRKKILIRICIALLCIFFIAVIVTANFLVSACLVPSFMETLDAFESVTEESYSDLVYTTDISENRKMLEYKADEWLETADEEKVTITSDDGYELTATLFMSKEKTEKWVLLLHGYTSCKEAMYIFAARYSENGYNVLVPDLRCQGESEGDFIGMGYTDSFDCMKWLDVILSKDPDAEIVIHGQSMGAATALIMTGMSSLPANVTAVIADSSYTDAYSMFGDKIGEWFHLPAFPLVDISCIMLQIRGGYDLKKASPLEAVKNSTTPTLFIHCTEDKMISVNMAYELYDAAACEKELLIVEDAGHGQAQDKEPLLYFNTVMDFIESSEELAKIVISKSVH